MTGYISEQQFAIDMRRMIEREQLFYGFRWVTGPGRSGAIASVYMSHMIGAPFIPYGANTPSLPGLVIDTATMTGATLRKAGREYPTAKPMAVYDERATGRLIFWYERDYKPQEIYSCPKCFKIALTKTDRCDQCKELDWQPVSGFDLAISRDIELTSYKGPMRIKGVTSDD